MTPERLTKIRKCCDLLPEPGPEVVRELLDEIGRLQTLLDDSDETKRLHTLLGED